MIWNIRLVYLALVSCGLPLLSHSIEVSVSPFIDSSIFEELPNNSAGVGPFIFAGVTGSRNNPDFQIRRGLIQFDIASVIPENAQIDSVALLMTVAKVPDEVFNFTTQTVHRVTSQWAAPTPGSGDVPNPGKGSTAVAGDATWSHSIFGSTEWANSGGDFVSTASAAAGVGPTVNATVSWTGLGLINDVEYWLTNPTMNFGWLIRGNDSGSLNQNARGYYSMDNTDLAAEGNLPSLVIEYTLVPEPATTALLFGSFALAFRILRIRRRG